MCITVCGCESGYPTPEEILLFSDNNNDAGNKDNNSFNTWKIAGIVGGATTLLGVVGASIYKIQSKKHKATDAESQSRGISGEAEGLISPQDLLNALQAKAGPGVTVVKTLKDAKELIEMPVHQEASPIYANLSENSDFEDSDYEIPCIGNQADYAIND